MHSWNAQSLPSKRNATFREGGCFSCSPLMPFLLDDIFMIIPSFDFLWFSCGAFWELQEAWFFTVQVSPRKPASLTCITNFSDTSQSFWHHKFSPTFPNACQEVRCPWWRTTIPQTCVFVRPPAVTHGAPQRQFMLLVAGTLDFLLIMRRFLPRSVLISAEGITEHDHCDSVFSYLIQSHEQLWKWTLVCLLPPEVHSQAVWAQPPFAISLHFLIWKDRGKDLLKVAIAPITVLSGKGLSVLSRIGPG